jgi:type I restriction enzyme S subunit
MDTEYEWIGTIPSHWTLKKIKFVFWDRKENNNPIKSENLISLTIEKGVIPHSEKTGGGNKPKEDLTKYKLVYPGDIVLNSMNVIAGAVGISRYFGVVSPVYYMLIPRDLDHSNEYFHHLFRTEIFQKSLYGLGNGILIKENEETGKLNTIRMRIPMDKLGDQFIPVPPAEEQNLIARYLNKKTKQIDRLVEKIQKKIELLKEQRTSLINQCVTKGLNPNVEMKDSGVEWIGDIPSHWSVSKIKWVSEKIGSGVTPRGGADVYSETGVPFLRSQNVHFDGLHLDDVVFISEEIDESMSGSRVQKNDVLYNITGGSIGRCCLVETDKKMNVNQHVCIVRPSTKVFPKYLLTVLSSDFGQRQLRMNLTGSGREGLNFENLGNFLIPVMGETEQVEIGSKISRTNAVFFELENKLRSQIDILKEYRQSLISSVVTGKFRVTEDMI